MKTLKKLSLLLLGICFLNAVQAKGVKFGKYSKEDIELTECAYENDAIAVVLHKSCIVDLSYRSINYFHHVRIKILKEEGLDYADVEIPYWRKDGIEKVVSVKGQTVNFDQNGKKVIKELDKKAVFNVDINENYGAARFSLPDVKVGSIIEYKYTTTSTFYTYLDTWYFQEEIPTLYSSIKVNMPESFRYNLVMFGDRIKSKYSDGKTNEWILTNLRSIKEEPYINNYMDFVEQIRFQLTGYYKSTGDIARGYDFVTVRSTWKDLAKEYLESFDFFGRKNFAKKVVDQILDGNENSWDKVQKIYDYVRTNVKWNEKYRIYPRKSPPKVLEDKIGSNSEINYLLVLLLREAGLKAEPALSRTNSRGLLQKDYPLMSQFNQSLAYVEIYNNKLFLNATSPYRPYKLLAEKDLNHYALILEKNKVRWERIKAYEKSRSQIMMIYDFSNTDEAICKLKIHESGYYASKLRRRIKDVGLETFLNGLVEGWDVDLNEEMTEVENLNDVNKPLIIHCDIPMDTELDFTADMIYFEPFPKMLSENPFLKENRQYRIDFNYNRYQSVLINFKLPKEYKVEDYPKTKVVRLANDLGEFSIVYQKITGNFQLKTIYEMNQPNFTKDYYGQLRELFSHMISSYNSQVVLKKTNTISEK